ncbi:hypothetical protein C7387_1702 [Yokenella regensburgei]|uniref:Uncharacterized protein n=1 Tax=Yokenella regensburgei TaxID=158877 RepID=A0ABX9S2E8_9ENTR|nr:hypothetical protein C7387_1702 [Yokenella regensburgei]VFS14517.1 Uncharacterised protein [Yokenella regensburgei]
MKAVLSIVHKGYFLVEIDAYLDKKVPEMSYVLNPDASLMRSAL